MGVASGYGIYIDVLLHRDKIARYQNHERGQKFAT